MLYLLFTLGENRFAVEAARVVEVLPLLQITEIPHAPKGVAGFFNYHGTPTPVIDLCQLVAGTPATKRLSTRVILINFLDREGKQHPAGVMAEQVTKTLQKEPADFVPSGITNHQTPYLGSASVDGEDFVQLIDAEKLLLERAHDLLTFLPTGDDP